MNPQRRLHLLSLLRSLQTSEAPTEGLEIQKGDFLDEASRVSEQAVTTELLKNRKGLLVAIKAALIHDSDLCEECEEAINPKRFEAVPWAVRCVGCQEREERSQRDRSEAARVRQYFRGREFQEKKTGFTTAIPFVEKPPVIPTRRKQ